MKFENVNGRRYYEEEEKVWLVENYPILGISETTRRFNEKFNRNKSISTLKRYCVMHLGLKVTNERKSHRYDAITSDVGTVSQNCRGEYKVKTENGWISAAHSIVDVPRGFVAIHLNGDKGDNSLDNIAVVKNGIQTILRNCNMWSSDREITKTGIAWCELYKLLEGENK